MVFVLYRYQTTNNNQNIMNKIYLIKVEHSNGFPNVSCELFDDYESAYKRKVEVENQIRFDGEYDDDSVEWSEDEFFMEDFRKDGYSVRLEIVSEKEMMSDIMNAVDESEMRHIFEHLGYVQYKMEVPMYKVHWNKALIPWGESEYEIKCIIRRPYYPEQPTWDDYIYDVDMVQHYGGFSEDEQGSEYTESLECVGSDIFAHIYCDIKGM